MRIGVIGLGNIGAHIAANLVADGHALVVYDQDATRARAVPGAAVAGAPDELARESEICFLSLPTPAAVRSVAEQWLRGAPAGSVLVDLSTNAPAAVRELGARVAERGCHLLEAPLTGGAPGAKARMLVFLVGGEREVFERCRPLLEKLGRASFHFGALGLGNTAKLVNSLLAFTATWVSLEGLAIAAKSGIDLRMLVEAVRTGGAGNFFIERMVEGLNQRGRPPQFALALAAKDAGLVVDVARQSGVPAPVAAQIAKVLSDADAAGLGAHDWSDLVLWIERQAEVELVLPPKRRLEPEAE
jgi:3-hydroxyisobutyrate dehydrogenase-like beta-hydroxyacid dehydrogenase